MTISIKTSFSKFFNEKFQKKNSYVEKRKASITFTNDLKVIFDARSFKNIKFEIGQGTRLQSWFFSVFSTWVEFFKFFTWVNIFPFKLTQLPFHCISGIENRFISNWDMIFWIWPCLSKNTLFGHIEPMVASTGGHF